LLWHLGARWMRDAADIGKLFGVYLLLSGIARFLVEFIRLNPRSFFGMTNAQTTSLVGMIVGAALLFRHGSRALQTRRIRTQGRVATPASPSRPPRE